MGTSHVDAYEAGHDPDLQAQLCAYNTAFAELGLRFRDGIHGLTQGALHEPNQRQSGNRR